MLVIPPRNLHKRQSRVCDIIQTSESSRKRQKCVANHRSPSSSAYWNNLSTIHLTRDALNEFDRRNNLHEDVTYNTTRSRANLLVNHHIYDRNSITAIRRTRFAHQGGPDMSEARGASNTTLVHVRRLTADSIVYLLIDLEERPVNHDRLHAPHDRILLQHPASKHLQRQAAPGAAALTIGIFSKI